jgi:hypothetical protein
MFNFEGVNGSETVEENKSQAATLTALRTRRGRGLLWIFDDLQADEKVAVHRVAGAGIDDVHGERGQKLQIEQKAFSDFLLRWDLYAKVLTRSRVSIWSC